MSRSVFIYTAVNMSNKNPYGEVLDKKTQFQLRFGFEKNRSSSFPASYPWYSRLDYRILLGGIPGTEMLTDLINTENVGGVLGLTTAEELHWSDSLDSHAYSVFDITYLHKTVDGISDMSVELINDCLNFIKSIIDQQRAVYVFSTDGRTRSCIIGICYLIRTYKMSTSDAIDDLKNVRPHAKIDDMAYRCCVEFAKAVRNDNPPKKPFGPAPADASGEMHLI